METVSSPYLPAIEALEADMTDLERQWNALLSGVNVLRGKAGSGRATTAAPPDITITTEMLEAGVIEYEKWRSEPIMPSIEHRDMQLVRRVYSVMAEVARLEAEAKCGPLASAPDAADMMRVGPVFRTITGAK